MSGVATALCVQSLLPVGGIRDETHEAAGDETRDGHGDEPTEVDPSNHAPVDGAPIAVAQTDTDDGASDALSGGDGELCWVSCVS